MLRRSALLLVLMAALVVCTADPPPTAATSTLPPDQPTTTPSFTTTTLPADSCDAVIADTAELLEDVVVELDGVTTDAFLDRRRWPERLFFLENEGVQIDQRIEALGCDPAAVQAAAFDRTDRREAESYPARELIRLLLGG